MIGIYPVEITTYFYIAVNRIRYNYGLQLQRQNESTISILAATAATAN